MNQDEQRARIFAAAEALATELGGVVVICVARETEGGVGVGVGTCAGVDPESAIQVLDMARGALVEGATSYERGSA